jgi:NAD(P)-dependent dehydrogenase (short-subunit alcohol dehydrogenase family)
MIRFQYLLSIMIATLFLLVLPSHAISQEDKATTTKSILITGASTGIGRHLAEALASEGYHVYAGARKDKDLASLNAIENITAIRLDVTIQDEVDAAVDLVKGKGTGLYALVNNAGIGGGGLVGTSDIADQSILFKVNVEGVYRITKAFMPLIVESEGRITTTGSIAGTVTRAGMSAYSGSKHWIEAFTDSLAAEMTPQNVLVSVIEPGNYQSFIRRNSVLRAYEKIEAAGGEITDEMKASFETTAAYEQSLKQPDEVTAAFMHALFDPNPLRRYVVTPNQDEQAFTIGDKIRQLVELNQWGPHSYSRDQLVEMLDKTIADKQQ